MNIKINDAVFESFPTLESSRLIFKEFEESDSQAMFELRSNPKTMRYMDSYSYKTIQEAASMIEQNKKAFQEKKGINWAIFEKKSNQFI
jgi:ribosomal-protein-alanine N-acetyltransferase